MRYGACFLFVVLLGSGCETDLNINSNTPSIPFVYAVLDAADTVHCVRLTKTFRTSYNIYQQKIPGDSLTVPNAVVKIERWRSGYYVETKYLDLTDQFTRDSGLFPLYPASVFELDKNTATAGYFTGYPSDLFRLIIEIPDRPVVYCEYHLVKPLSVISPMHDGRTYDMFNFHVLFKSFANYSEMYVRLHYLNRYNDSTSSETTTWREFHDHEIIDETTGREFSVPLEGNAFFERIGKLIHRDEKVLNRKFEYTELLFNCLDENIYQYNESLTVLPSDQAGSPFTNVVNGKGIVGSRYTRRTTILFDQASLEELCNGKYTKHLKFVDW
jgi:hypothetical protein